MPVELENRTVTGVDVRTLFGGSVHPEAILGQSASRAYWR